MELGHGRLLAEGPSRVLAPGGVPHQHPGRLHLGGHVRQRLLDCTLAADGLSELLPFVGELDGPVQRRLGYAEGLGGDADAAHVQGHHGDLEPLAAVTQLPGRRDVAVLEDQLGLDRRPDAQLVLDGPEGEARVALAQYEGGDAPGALGPVLHGEDDVHVGHGGVGDEVLDAVEDVPVPVGICDGLLHGGIGARRGLGEAVGAQGGAVGDGHQVVLLLLLGPEGQEGVAGEGVVDRHRDGGGRAGPRYLLDGHGVRDGVAAAAPVLLGHRHAQDAQVAQPLDDLLGEPALRLVLGDDGLDLVQGEITDHLLNHQLLLVQGEVHSESPSGTGYWPLLGGKRG